MEVPACLSRSPKLSDNLNLLKKIRTALIHSIARDTVRLKNY